MQLGDIPSTSVNFPCGRETFRQHPSTVRAAGRPLSTFHAAVGLLLTSSNFPCDSGIFCELTSIFCTAGRLSDNVHQISVHPGDALSTSINFKCSLDTFCQLSMLPGDLPLTSVKFLHGWEAFRLLLSTSCAARRFSVNLRRENFHQISSTFLAVGRLSVNFRQLSVQPAGLPSISINFPCS